MLARLRDRFDGAPVTRFAPSPTGRLHLGHIVNAIYVWGVARALGGVVRLRIEDHDRERSRTEFDRGIIADLEWLGFLPDATERQSDHADRYWDALGRLSDAGLVYWCGCSRQRIAREAWQNASELRYGADGEKLSKSNHDTGICELRDAGVSPAEVIGRSAAAAGLIDRARPLSANEVDRLFRAQWMPELKLGPTYGQ